MIIAVAQQKIYPGQPELNKQAMLSMIGSAVQGGASMVIFPELAVSGLLMGNLGQNAAFVAECLAADKALAAAATIPVIYGNLSLDGRGRLQNAVNLVHQGELFPLEPARAAAFIPHAYGAFAPAPAARVHHLSLAGREWRIGCRLGDWRDADFDGGDLDLLVDISAQPLLLDKDYSQPMPKRGTYIRVNGCGLQSSGKSNYLLQGGSFARTADSRLIARAPLFAEGLFFWDLAVENDIAPSLNPDELLLSGLTHGVREFLAAIHCGKAVIGLSGGIDSALAACVYTQVLGPENVYLINMPSRFNSSTTKDLAARTAQALGCPYGVIPVEHSSNQLVEDLVAGAIRDSRGNSIPLAVSGGVRENVLARDRCRILAGVAAAVGGIFTCNGNKAECTAGYATFYGDLAGALAAQADLWKFQVYQASQTMQRLYPDAPLAETASIRPSAELSEAQDVDKGLGDPIHYRYHDYLFRAWVELGMDISDTLRLYLEGGLAAAIGCQPGLPAALFKDAAAFCADQEYWWKLYRGMGVAKRIQAPPLLAFSAHPFGEPQGEALLAPWLSAAYLALKAKALQ